MYRWPLLKTPVAALARRLANDVSAKRIRFDLPVTSQKQHADENRDVA